MKQRIGILGGTFDPIHEGHIAIAKQVLKKFNLDHVEFIPCFQPPHRDEPIASAMHRLAMVQLAIQNEKQLVVNDCEIKQEGISYTVDTIKSLRESFLNNHYYLILGADAFSQFDTWHEWKKIITLADIIVVSRDDQTIQTPVAVDNFILKNKIKKQIHFFSITPIPISATHIRADITAQKKNISGLNDAVFRYILSNSVYR